MPPPALVLADLPSSVARAVWRGDDLARPGGAVVASGWAALDAELPGGGWPCGELAEVLSPQPSLLEWRLLGAALQQVTADGGCVVLVGPPKPPYMPGLQALGLEPRQLIWVQTETPAQRLWATEQLVQAETAGAVLAWLPQARTEHLRRLQSRLQGGRTLCIALRPEGVRSEASPAGLRVLAQPGPDWTLRVQVLKRRGPLQEQALVLPAVPRALEAVLNRRSRLPGRSPSLSAGARHAVVRPAPVRPVPAG
ncbi:MAG: translesion DNA synthesis-associated protein ImuA [Thiomonas arsenitoxydans]|uniref:Translesion DNA synthesis-associated protein ImuA n=1 Tax=Thiomonas arsenitoxydans (strain DSM 22701 / CIP 110005 / 3As) TaxID=426114 RepID=A0A8I1N037_THIA3|nr:translesion DNA synthesis-associated protein ImuA [Thiomonas arsenitoxydans]MBN8745459.1 translesion DNA synthesis-associated protein ImuA [Thiomonas arsenitoxydans]ODV09435.1 MAG: recombinase RecA [Rubrivivax sp. SCN 70-15]